MKKHVFLAIVSAVLVSLNSAQAQDFDPAPLFEGFGDAVESPQAAQPQANAPLEAQQKAQPAPAEPVAAENQIPKLSVSGRSDSDIRQSKPSVMELRQARAMYRSAQRIARMERNLWYGYEPLRPGWTTVHYMQSRYDYQRTVFVPVYYYGR